MLVHLVSPDTKVMKAVQDWGWTDGMWPAGNAPVWGVEKMRDRFIAAFSKQTTEFARLNQTGLGQDMPYQNSRLGMSMK